MIKTIPIGNWIGSHKKMVLVHSLILCSFVLYSLFLSGPLFDRFESIPDEAQLIVDIPLPAETNNVRYSLDRLIILPSAFEVQGWAFIDGYSTENNLTYIVLESVDTSYIFDTFAVFNNNITDLYGGPDLNLDWSGFTTTIPVRKIEKGYYTIGIYIIRNGTTGLQYSNKVLSKDNNGVKLINITSRNSQ